MFDPINYVVLAVALAEISFVIAFIFSYLPMRRTELDIRKRREVLSQSVENSFSEGERLGYARGYAVGRSKGEVKA